MSFSLRRDLITRPIYAWAHKALPPMSDTEREALEAGDVWWDADLFTGNPDWSKLLAFHCSMVKRILATRSERRLASLSLIALNKVICCKMRHQWVLS